MEQTKKRSDEEVSIKRWENEGGEIPKTAKSSGPTGAAIERRENEGGKNQHTDTTLPSTMIETSQVGEGPGRMSETGSASFPVRGSGGC